MDFDSFFSSSYQVEFDVRVSDAGNQFIEGQQIYKNIIVQQFTLRMNFFFS